MSRVVGWRDAFDGLIKSKLDQKFEWGTADCLQFVFAVDRAISQPSRFCDVSEYLVYETEREAKELMDDWGMPDVDAIMDARLERVPANFLAVGDVGLVKYRTKNVLSVCVGRKFAHPWTTGLGYTDRSKIAYGWRI